MLGSVIPKRWLVSLALVGLVSLFIASFGAGWAGTASAGTTTGGSTPTPVPAGSVLSNLSSLTQLNLQTGQVIGLNVSPVDDNGNINLGLPGLTYHWNAGSCGSIDDTASRTPTFTASSSGCSGSIDVHAYQGLGSAVPPGDGFVINVSVAAPAPAPAATAVPVDPLDIPDFSTISHFVNDDFAGWGVVLPSTGGNIYVTETIGSSLERQFLLSIPGSALGDGIARAAAILLTDSGSVPPPPPAAFEGASSGTFTFGSSIVEISWFEPDGTVLDTIHLNRPAQLCLPFNQADIDKAAGGPDGLALWRHNGTDWIQLNSTVNMGDHTVCGRTLDFSFFTLGLAVAAPDSVDAELPVTGDYTPGVGALILAMLAGIALVAGGAFTARRARRVRVTSRVS